MCLDPDLKQCIELSIMLTGEKCKISCEKCHRVSRDSFSADEMCKFKQPFAKAANIQLTE